MRSFPDRLSLYRAVCGMHQFRGAARVLEACLESDGCTDLSFQRPDGRSVRLVVASDQEPGLREMWAETEDGTRTVLLGACVDPVSDRLELRVHSSLLEVKPTQDGGDAARDVLADVVALASAVSGAAPAARMVAGVSASAVQYYLYHAGSARRLMDRMAALASDDQRVEVMELVATQLKEYHRLAERSCNEGDPSDKLWDMMKAIEQQLREKMAAAGCPKVRFCSDPRGSSMCLEGGREGDVYFAQVPDEILKQQQLRAAPARRAVRKPAAGPAAAAGASTNSAGAALQPVELRERAVSPEVLQVLRASRLEGERLYLPDQLPRPLYEAVDEAIRIAGGRWVGGRTRAHVFTDSAQVLTRLIATGQILDPKEYDFFATPAALAREAVEAAGIEPGMLVAEPSAGRGAIAAVMAEIVGTANVHAYELLPDHVKVLREMGLQVHEGDFLAQPARPIFDRIVMNPPFGQQADMKHVQHALKMLKPTGRLVAITSPAHEHRKSKQADEFRALMNAAGVKLRDVESGAFKESGTDVRTVMVRFEADRLPWNQDGLAQQEDVETEVGQRELFAQQLRA